jgi:heme A synthase
MSGFRSIAARSAIGSVALAAALVAGTAPAWADAPPSDPVFPREQTWACGDLGTFVTLYGTPGQGAVLWLSPDGGRTDAVQVTVLAGEITLTFGDEVYHYSSRDPAPQRAGQDQFRCEISGSSPDGWETISGWTLVGVVGSGAGPA